MPVRASTRRAGVEVPYDVQYAIAMDPAGFDAKVMEWNRRKQAALITEAAGTAAVAAANAEQDRLAKDRAEFNAQHAAAGAKLTAERDAFTARAKAENDRLVQWDSELADRERRNVEEKARLDELAGTVARNFNESVAAKQAADSAKRLAETNAGIAAELRARLEERAERIRQFGAELRT